MAQSLPRTTRLLSTRLFSTATVLPPPSQSPLPLSHLTSTVRSTSISCQSYGPGNLNYSPLKSGYFFQMSNGEELAKKKIYNVSCERYFGFGSFHNKQEVAKRFTYYRTMGGNPMIQQNPLHRASNVRFYSSSSSATATSKTQQKEKSYPTVFWHLHEGIEEIVADYVHHEMEEPEMVAPAGRGRCKKPSFMQRRETDV